MTGQFQPMERICREVACPQCSAAIRFSTVRLQETPQPFMYCSQCSNVLLRRSDDEAMFKALQGVHDVDSAALRFYEQLEKTAPACSCGHDFALWANVKCPHCSHEIPYNHGVRDVAVRMNDSTIIVLEGAEVIGDSPAESWVCKCGDTRR